MNRVPWIVVGLCLITGLAGAEVKVIDYGPMPDSSLITGVQISANCRNVAVSAYTSAEQLTLTLNEKVMAAKQELPAFVLSNDGMHVACVTMRSGGLCVEIDKKAGPSFDRILTAPSVFRFAPKANRFAYIGQRGKRWFVVVDGKETDVGDHPPAELLFSPDGTKLAYILQHGARKVVVLDGVQLGEFLDVTQLMFSANSMHLAAGARIDEHQWVVLNNQDRSEVYEAVQGLTFDATGKRTAFIARTSPKPDDAAFIVVVDGKPGPLFSRITFGPCFSDDGAHVIYEAESVVAVDANGETWVKWNLMIDGVAKDFPRVQELKYGPDGGHIRAVVIEQGGPVTNAGRLRKYEFQVDETNFFLSAVSMGGIVLSPDTKRVAFAARPHNPAVFPDFRWTIVVDWKAGDLYQCVGPAVFSPNSKHIAYAAQKGNNWVLNLDGRELPYLLLIPFVAGGQPWKPVYVPELREESGKRGVGPRREDFISGTTPYCFDEDGGLRFIAVKDGRICAVTLEPD